MLELYGGLGELVRGELGAAGEGGANGLGKGPEEDGVEQDVAVGGVEGSHLGVLGGDGVVAELWVV
jgi:hypothetical protein